MKRLVVCAGGNEQFDFATGVGVGMVDAALGVARLLSLAMQNGEMVSEVVFVGSCGLYLDSEGRGLNNLQILDIFETKIAANIEAAAVLKMGYSPAEILDFNGSKKCYIGSDILRASGKKDSDMGGICADKNGIVSHETIAINSSNFITTDALVATEIARLGFAGENMELFGVFRAARAFGVMARGILCATNICGKTAHEEFMANHNEAKRRLGDWAISGLAN